MSRTSAQSPHRLPSPCRLLPFSNTPRGVLLSRWTVRPLRSTCGWSSRAALSDDVCDGGAVRHQQRPSVCMTVDYETAKFWHKRTGGQCGQDAVNRELRATPMVHNQWMVAWCCKAFMGLSRDADVTSDQKSRSTRKRANLPALRRLFPGKNIGERPVPRLKRRASLRDIRVLDVVASRDGVASMI